jgi:hypothetical protein
MFSYLAYVTSSLEGEERKNVDESKREMGLGQVSSENMYF